MQLKCDESTEYMSQRRLYEHKLSFSREVSEESSAGTDTFTNNVKGSVVTLDQAHLTEVHWEGGVAHWHPHAEHLSVISSTLTGLFAGALLSSWGKIFMCFISNKNKTHIYTFQDAWLCWSNRTHLSKSPNRSKCPVHRECEWSSWRTSGLWTWPAPVWMNHLDRMHPRWQRKLGHRGNGRHGRSRGTLKHWRWDPHSGHRGPLVQICTHTDTPVLGQSGIKQLLWMLPKLYFKN